MLGKTVFDALTSTMTDHSFFTTENPSSSMEILVGVNKDFQTFATQREEFQSKVPTLRPGALTTLTIDGTNYPILLLHVKSLQVPRPWGLRDDMFRHVRSLKHTLDNLASEGETTPVMVLGNLNAIGLNVAYADNDLDENEEIEVLCKRLNTVNMRSPEHTHE